MKREIASQKGRCTRCGKGDLVTDPESGEVICGKCGFVVTENLEESGPEWRSFTGEDNGGKARAGAPTSLTMHDMGLATTIDPVNKDATGKPLSVSMQSTINRLRTWDNKSKAHRPADRNFRQAFSELDRMKDKLALSDAVIEKAAYLYRKALEKELIRGRTISTMIGAALYAACRDAQTPRTLHDIAMACNVKKKDVSRGYRILYRELDLKMPVADPIGCVSRIASRAELSEKSRRTAIKILKTASENEISAGKEPMGFAAAALYIASIKNGEDITQKDIANAAGVTEITIRNRYKGLKETMDL